MRILPFLLRSCTRVSPIAFPRNRIIPTVPCSNKPFISVLIEHRKFERVNLDLNRSFSTAPNNQEVVIYSSPSENFLNLAGVGSIVQAGICTVVAGLVTLHPAAAASALLPNWTFEGRAMLGGLIIGFGASMCLGFKGFLTKNIVRVATLPSDPDHLHIYIYRFPSGIIQHRVPRKEFYAISAAYNQLDLQAERTGPAPVVPVFVGGQVTGTFLIDISGGIKDPATMQRLLSEAADSSSCSTSDTSGSSEVPPAAGSDAKRPFVPNRHRSKLRS